MTNITIENINVLSYVIDGSSDSPAMITASACMKSIKGEQNSFHNLRVIFVKRGLLPDTFASFILKYIQ